MDPKIPLTDLCAFSHHGGIQRRDCRGHAEQPRLRGPEPLRRGARTTSRGHSPRVSRLLAATLEPAGSDPRRTEPPRIDPGSATLTGTGPRAPVEGGVCSVYGDPQWIVVLKVRRRVPAGGQTCPRAPVSRCFRHVYLQLPEVSPSRSARREREPATTSQRVFYRGSSAGREAPESDGHAPLRPQHAREHLLFLSREITHEPVHAETSRHGSLRDRCGVQPHTFKRLRSNLRAAARTHFFFCRNSAGIHS